MPWTRYAIRTLPALGSARPSWRAALARLPSLRWCSSGSLVAGLRGVGKTVLLNTFRSMAIGRLWGTGKIEARPDQSIRRPVAGALHMAVRELAPRHRAPDRVEYFLGVLKAFALRDPTAPKGSSVTVALGIDVLMQRGRADSGDLEVDLTELFAEAASVAADLGVGIALFVDEMQDIPA